MSKWLNIKDYSKHSGLSVSTIRRKIKDSAIKFKKEEGKYFIFLDDGSEKPDKKTKSSSTSSNTTSNKTNNVDFIKFAEKSISSINKLNLDLIEEKEKRLAIQDDLIKQLKEEVVELRMLVKVLENNIKN